MNIFCSHVKHEHDVYTQTVVLSGRHKHTDIAHASFVEGVSPAIKNVGDNTFL